MLITDATYQKVTYPYRPKLYLPVVHHRGIRRATRNTTMRSATAALEYSKKVMKRYNRMVQYCNDKMVIEQIDKDTAAQVKTLIEPQPVIQEKQ